MSIYYLFIDHNISMYHSYIYCYLLSNRSIQLLSVYLYLSIINLPVIRISIYLSPNNWSALWCRAAGVSRLGASVAAARPAVQPAVPAAQQQARRWRRRHQRRRRWRRRRRLHQHQSGRRGRGVAGVRRPHIRLKNWWGRHRLWLSLLSQIKRPDWNFPLGGRTATWATQYNEYLYTPLSSMQLLCPVLFQIGTKIKTVHDTQHQHNPT